MWRQHKQLQEGAHFPPLLRQYLQEMEKDLKREGEKLKCTFECELYDPKYLIFAILAFGPLTWGI